MVSVLRHTGSCLEPKMGYLSPFTGNMGGDKGRQSLPLSVLSKGGAGPDSFSFLRTLFLTHPKVLGVWADGQQAPHREASRADSHSSGHRPRASGPV